MESGNLSAETFMSLEDNFIYLGIGIVQTCNGNAVIMGAVVSFIKTLIKIKGTGKITYAGFCIGNFILLSPDGEPVDYLPAICLS